MAKLATINTGLASIGSPLQPATNTQAARDSTRTVLEPWRAWYHTKRWSKIRWRVLTRDAFTCQYPGCGLITHKTGNLVAHHKRKHRGNATLFWDENNIETVCKWCHDGPIKAAERNPFTQGGG